MEIDDLNTLKEIGDFNWKLSDYRITITPECQSALLKQELTTKSLIDLIADEFRSHLNYFRFDLEDYVMPLKGKFMVFLDKVQNQITIKNLLPCTKNEAKLASWNDILALYRRATRLSYRQTPEKLFSNRSLFKSVQVLHLDLGIRIIKHFDIFDGLRVCPERLVLLELNNSMNSEWREEVKYLLKEEEPLSKADSIAFHLFESATACKEGLQIEKDFESDLIGAQETLGGLVTCLERSLQHLHKILLEYPPVS